MRTWLLILGWLAAGPAPLEILHVANEGFLLRSGEEAVLVDALFLDGLGAYATPPAPLRDALVQGTGPFAGVSWVLATHQHSDHFDAGWTASFLRANPATRFVGPPPAAERVLEEDPELRKRVHAILPEEGTREEVSAEVTVVNLHHGRQRQVPNLGFVVDIGGWRILHVGDTQATAEEFAALDLGELDLDLAFLPFWRLGEDATDLLTAIGAARVVPMHIPVPGRSAGYYGDPGSRAALWEELLRHHPDAVVLRSPGARVTLPAAAPAGGR